MPATHEILPPALAIKSMRSSGYKDTAHAVAELIDNSIQAGIGVNQKTEVEVLCIDTSRMVSQRRRKHIKTIAVYDNASGMDPDTLRIALQFGNGTRLDPEQQKGIGKFGMGLPNASISQCRRVDVWSWQDGTTHYTYLDVDEIQTGKLREVPEPEPSEIPAEWIGLIRSELGEHGTLVVWSKLDRVSWKRSKAFFDNAETLIGRIYRYFIHDGSVSIRMASFTQDSAGTINEDADEDRTVRPNDPLFLMKGTSAPSPYDEEPAFDEFGDPQVVELGHDGKTHRVVLRFSVAKQQPRDEGGNSAIGRFAAKNQGVSIVRARRELEVNRSFDSRSDPRERWWGVEVAFDPALDNVFGVSNNKQAATAFMNLDLDEDAKAEGMSPGAYRELLEENSDPRLLVYELSFRIRKTLKTLREQIKRMGTPRKRRSGAPPAGSPEAIATRVTHERRQKTGKEGTSDADEKRPAEEREKELTKELVSEGVPEQEAREIAVEYVRTNMKFMFQEADVPSSAIFDVRSKAGVISVIVNRRHPASEHLFELLKRPEADGEDEAEPPTLIALKLLLSAWARMEDEAGFERRQNLEDIRHDWGRLARDFLQAQEL